MVFGFIPWKGIEGGGGSWDFTYSAYDDTNGYFYYLGQNENGSSWVNPCTIGKLMGYYYDPFDGLERTAFCGRSNVPDDYLGSGSFGFNIRLTGSRTFNIKGFYIWLFKSNSYSNTDITITLQGANNSSSNNSGVSWTNIHSFTHNWYTSGSNIDSKYYFDVDYPDAGFFNNFRIISSGSPYFVTELELYGNLP